MQNAGLKTRSESWTVPTNNLGSNGESKIYQPSQPNIVYIPFEDCIGFANTWILSRFSFIYQGLQSQ